MIYREQNIYKEINIQIGLAEPLKTYFDFYNAC